VAISNSASPEIIWGPGGPKEDHQLHHCCWTGRVDEREEGEEGGELSTALDCVCCLTYSHLENTKKSSHGHINA